MKLDNKYLPPESMNITNKFRTKHKVSGTHEGVDFITKDLIVRFPTRLYRGRVIYVGYEPTGLGKYVVFRSISKKNKTRIVIMGHFEKIFVDVGKLVFGNYKIGIMGDSGNAQGKHCHLEVLKAVDPTNYLRG